MLTTITLSLGGFFSGLLGSATIYRLGRRLALVDVPNERSSHSVLTPRGAGIGIWAFFALASVLVLDNWPIALTGGAFGLFGLLEDRFSLSSKPRLFVHLALSSLIVFLWSGPPAHFQAAVTAAFWIVFIAGTANFYNFMDGINGIAGLTGAIAFGLLSFFSYSFAGRPDIALMAIAVAAGCLGFLPFNIPRARVFLGDTGSLFLGAVFAALAFLLSSGPEALLCLAMFLSPFYADALITIALRIKKGENLLTPHRSHLYQSLCNRSGLAHWKVALLYASIQLIFGALSMAAYYLGSIVLQILVIAPFVVFFSSFYILAGQTTNQRGGFIKNLLQPSRFKKVLLFIILDVLTTILSLYLAFLFRFDFVFPPGYSGLFAVSLPFFAVLRLIVFVWSKIYRITWRYVGVRDLYDIVTASAVAQLAIIASVYVLLPALFIDLSGFKGFPRGIFLIDGVLFVVLTATLRVSKRVFLEVIGRKRQAKYGEKTLIVGAGNMGELILRDMIKQNFSIFHPVGFLDDDEKLVGTYIHGVKVLGKIESLKAFVRQHRVETVIIAIPSLNFRVLRKIYEAAREAKVKNVKTVPRIYDFNRPEVSLKSLEEIRVEDLLGRQTVKVDCDNNRQLLARKSIFVTGAGGSIGSELVRQICAFDPEKVVLLDNNETALHDMEIHLKGAYPHFFLSRAGCSLNDRVSFIVGDIRDRESVARAFRTYRPDIVFHSAAYKHVPMMEYNPAEAVKVNILGSHIVAKTAIECGVEKFILISTDKAVRPTSVMGATKRIAEHICKASNGRGTVFVSVRFGNVLGSRGSILPLFMEQLRNGGPLTVTHRDMKRYFMTIPEAVSLVLQASVIGKAEDVLVLDMGEPVSILSLAEELIRLNGLQPYKDVDINFIGLRPGENLFEDLLTAEEGTVATDHEKIFVAKSSESYSMHEIESILEEFESTVSGPFTDHQKITDTIRKYVKQFEISQKTCMEKI